ncbi:MAG: caspase family protein [Ferruginibacter sp.]
MLYQDIYEIKFNIAAEKENNYTALIIKNSDNSSQVRIRKINKNTRKSTVYGLSLLTDIDQLKKERKKNISPPVIYGNDTSELLQFLFSFFSMDYFNKIKFSPNGKVQFIKKDKITDADVSGTKYIRREDIQPAYLIQFFSAREKLYSGFFQKSAKQIESTPNFYFIAVANTKESTIGSGCNTDLINIGVVFQQIANDLDLPYKLTTISAGQFTKHNVLNAITDLKPRKQDIVLFYYSGHGFSFKDDSAHVYPQLDLRNNPPVYSEAVIKASTVNIEEVYEMIREKKARLNLVISDCCNSLIEFYRYYPNPNIVPQPYNFPINKEVASLLFLKTNASVLATAASKGQYAVSDEKTGGIFTGNFCEQLYSTCYDLSLKSSDVSWAKILQQTHKNTLAASATYDCGKGVGCVQEPVFVIKKN